MYLLIQNFSYISILSFTEDLANAFPFTFDYDDGCGIDYFLEHHDSDKAVALSVAAPRVRVVFT